MKKLNVLARTTIIGAALLGITGASNAATVTFDNFTSAVPKLFVAPGGPVTGTNLLSISLDEFVANSLSPVAFDTIAFSVTAPTGFVITKIEYKESTHAVITTAGFAASTGSLSANGDAHTLGFHMYGSATDATDDLSTLFSYSIADATTLVNVVITNSLVAVGFPGGTSTVSKAGPGALLNPTFEVTLAAAPVPLPPAAWMLGSALVGLVTVGRRKLGV